MLYYIVTDKNTFDKQIIGQELWSVTPSPMILYDKQEVDGECRLIFTQRVAGSRELPAQELQEDDHE